MDGARFDTLARSLHDTRPRRAALAAGLGATLSVLGLFQADAKKGKGKSKKKKTRRRPSPLAPSCTDRVKNGSETGVDCGGPTCPRCADGLGCARRNDCASFVCTGGTCAACGARGALCGPDADGSCSCEQPAAGGPTGCYQENDIQANNCAECETGRVCIVDGPGSVDCRKPCGAS
jgi:hypothetical protein